MIGNIFKLLGYIIAAIWTLFKIVFDIVLVIFIIAIILLLIG